jgi:3-hydroxyisobutyrate dehydrogenase-like beta-hydroxyacid dehydrogenase
VTTDLESIRTGMIGLGSLGSAVFTGLHRAGHAPTSCYDKHPPPAARFPDIHLPFVDSPRAVADASDVVLILVFDEDQVSDVLFGEGGIIGSTRRPLRVVVMSTVSIDFISSANETLATAGIELLDCGINGAPGIVDRGKAVASVGGTVAAFEAVKPVLDLVADPTVYMGASGNGMKAKLVRNMIVYATWYVAWQGAALAAASGLDAGKILQIVDNAEPHAHGATFAVHAARARARRTAPGAPDGSALTEVAQKDLNAALALGRSYGLELPLMGQIAQDYARLETVPPGSA